MTSPVTLNLAAEPFENLRPYRRTAATLGILALLLLAVNAYLFWRYQSGSAELRRQLREVEAEIAAELDTIGGLEASIGSLDLEAQNEQVDFLNDRIAERTFPWSLFFDRLGDVLPPGVRLDSLTPSRGDERLRRRRSRVDEESVTLQITGDAKSDDQLYAFVDALFEHPSFLSPKLHSEQRDDRGFTAFTLAVRYLPVAEQPDAPEESEPGDQGSEVARTESMPGSAGEQKGREPAAAATAATTAAGAQGTVAGGVAEPAPGSPSAGEEPRGADGRQPAGTAAPATGPRSRPAPPRAAAGSRPQVPVQGQPGGRANGGTPTAVPGVVGDGSVNQPQPSVQEPAGGETPRRPPARRVPRASGPPLLENGGA